MSQKNTVTAFAGNEDDDEEPEADVAKMLASKKRSLSFKPS